MANLPHFPSMDVDAIVESISTWVITSANAEQDNNDRTNMQLVEQLVNDLINPNLRENAITELAKKKELFPDLGPLLWNTFGTIDILLKEIALIYPYLTPPTLTPAQSCRVGYVLAILQCAASHRDTLMLFIDGGFLFYLSPLVNCSSNLMSCEYLRLRSLDVIHALVKDPETSVISYNDSAEIMSLCFTAMELGNELSKSVATLIVKNILEVKAGLEYACSTVEHFNTVSRALEKMVTNLVNQSSPRILKYIVGCYLQLSTHSRGRRALVANLPIMLRDSTVAGRLCDDPVGIMWLQQLLINVEETH